MATIMELNPFLVALGESPINYEFGVVEHATPYVAGGPATPAMSDDSDGTYVQLQAWQDIDGNKHTDTISAHFNTPAGVTPTALALKIRARSSSDVLNTSPEGLRLVMQTVDDPTTGEVIDSQVNGNLSGDYPLRPLATATAAQAAWFHWYYPGNEANLDDPTEAGFWLGLEPFPAAVAALTERSLRVSLGVQWASPVVDDQRRWVDLFEFRLLVAYEPRARAVPPLRVVQRGNDGLGFTGGRRVVGGRSVQSSNRRGSAIR